MEHLFIRSGKLSQDLLSILHSRTQSGPLFLALTSLACGPYGFVQPILLAMITPFISTSLSRLSIIFPRHLDMPDEAIQVLSALLAHTPSLEVLHIHASSHVANAAFEAASSLPNLDTLYTEGFAVPQTFLVPLARSDNLRKLSITLGQNSQFTTPTASIPAFHSLEVIYLNTTETSYATLFILNFLVGSPLREITLGLPQVLNPEDIQPLASAMVQAFHHDSITTIRVWCSESAAELSGDPIYMLNPGMLRELFVFRRLETFNFNVRMHYAAIDDKFIGDLTTHWPALRELSLVPAGGTPCPVISLTFEGLVHFSKSRNLTHLDVLFDGNTCNIWTNYPAVNGPSCPSLCHLNVHASSFNFRDLEIVAGLIFDLFPNLQDDIESREPSFEELDGVGRTLLWNAVSSQYHLLSRARG